jgi:c-di-GMP-binding flagellar brake protein YcgR
VATSANDLPDPLRSKGEILVRSRSEIARILQVMLEHRRPLTASLEGCEELFVSQLLRVDEDLDRIELDYGAAKAANTALLAAAAVPLQCSYGDAHLHFICAAPRQISDGGIALAFPPAVLILHRRELRRFRIPPEVPLRCDVGWGRQKFEGQVVDLSRAGIGVLIHDPKVRLDPGMRIGARIFVPERAPVEVTLDVRHTRREILPDGTQRVRSGCRVEGSPEDIAALARLFVYEIDDRNP